MAIKDTLKKTYMILNHPDISFHYGGMAKSLFIGSRSNIKGLKNFDLGNNVHFGNDVRLQSIGEKKNVFVGDNCYFCHRDTILALGKIQIGSNVLVASDVCIISENHSADPTSDIPYKDQKLIAKDVSIGDNCWIGEKVLILPGARIGQGCIIGAGSIVTKSIPDYSIAVGNPARVIKQYNFEINKWERVNA